MKGAADLGPELPQAPDALELLQQQSVLIEHIVSTRQALERLATKALAGDDAERREVFAALEAAGGRVDRLRLSGEEPQRAPVCWADEDHQPTQQHQQQHVPPPWLIGRRMSREHHRGGGSSLPNLRRSSFGEFHTGVGVRSSVRSSFGDSHNGTVATRNSAPRQSCSAVSPMRAPTSEKSSFSSADGRSFAVHPRPSSSASMSDARASSPSSGGPLLPRRIAIVAPSEVVGRTVRGRLTAGSSAHLADCVVPDVAVYESLEAAADDPAPVVVICYSGAETVFDAAAARSLPRFYWTAATADGPEHEQEQEQDQFLQLRQHERGYVVVGDVSPETQDVIHMELYGFCDLVRSRRLLPHLLGA